MNPKPVFRHEIDAVADAFFRQSSLAPIEIDAHESDRHADREHADQDYTDQPQLSHGSRRAMHATLVILGTSVVALGSFLFYTKVLMPTPAELGVGGAISVPVLAPIAAAEPPREREREIQAPVPPQELGARPAVLPAVLTSTVASAATNTMQNVRVRTSAPVSTKARAVGTLASAEDGVLRQAYRDLNAGRLEGAIRQARRVLDSTPTRADAWLVLGSAYDAMHDHASAKLAFRACAARAHGAYLHECEKLARE